MTSPQITPDARTRMNLSHFGRLGRHVQRGGQTGLGPRVRLCLWGQAGGCVPSIPRPSQGITNPSAVRLRDAFPATSPGTPPPFALTPKPWQSSGMPRPHFGSARALASPPHSRHPQSCTAVTLPSQPSPRQWHFMPPSAQTGSGQGPPAPAVAPPNSSSQGALVSSQTPQSRGAGGKAAFPRVVLSNTQTGVKEELRPLQEGKVGMYVCGVTVYDLSHIGHARVYVAFDALFRYLLSLGFEVTYVRNFTDVDDKILKRANETGEDPLALSDRFIREFHTDMESLGCLPPSFEPKVSDHIPEIVAMIQQILERGHAYAVEGGDVLFSVASAQDYGVLSGRKLEDNRAGERVEVDPRKRHPADFALWKAAKEGEGVAWDSPWGKGRPGWHIECSAMSARYLGYQFDIHGGGQDLVFPHHENELAQSRAACPECHVSTWMHNGFVNIDSEKMSKSLGNFFTIREVLESYHPLALRWFLLNTHYRSPINFSQRQLATASDRLYYVYQALNSSHRAMAEGRQEGEEGGGPSGAAAAAAESSSASPGGQAPAKKQAKPSKAAQAVAKAAGKEAWEALADDLHSGRALASLSEVLKLMGELANPKKKKAPIDTASLSVLLESVSPVLQALGFPTQPEECSKVLGELSQYALSRAGLTQAALNARMQERARAREAKDFAMSDSIRNELAKSGILLMDGPTGQSWCPSATDALSEEGQVTDVTPEKTSKVAA